MKVELLTYTPDALDLLLYTKNSRLTDGSAGFDAIKAWPMDRKEKELGYMLDTIQSSWEFCDYAFAITGVSRAFTHQFVRTRTGSYAQQSQRAVPMSGFEYITPSMSSSQETEYRHIMDSIQRGYDTLLDEDAQLQVARGILPTNVATNLVAKFNLRTLADTAKTRLCVRTQGEYQDVFREMRARVIEVHPWAEPFIRVACASTGVCAFPRYEDCPIKPGIFNPNTGGTWPGAEGPSTKDEIQARWEGLRFEADPHG
jgi:flavin-dependent thymidylate synthase